MSKRKAGNAAHAANAVRTHEDDATVAQGVVLTVFSVDSAQRNARVLASLMAAAQRDRESTNPDAVVLARGTSTPVTCDDIRMIAEEVHSHLDDGRKALEQVTVAHSRNRRHLATSLSAASDLRDRLRNMSNLHRDAAKSGRKTKLPTPGMYARAFTGYADAATTVADVLTLAQSGDIDA
mgnify:CR=1 FL=1